MHHRQAQITDGERLAVLEQVIELAAVGGEARFGVEDIFEGRLHFLDVLTEADGHIEAIA